MGKGKRTGEESEGIRFLFCKSSKIDSLTVSDSVSKPHFSKCLNNLMAPNTFWRQLVFYR